jgi:hypothetical protein
LAWVRDATLGILKKLRGQRNTAKKNKERNIEWIQDRLFEVILVPMPNFWIPPLLGRVSGTGGCRELK